MRVVSSSWRDPAGVADEVDQGEGEFVVVDVLDVAAAGVGGGADGGERRAGEGEEFAVAEDAGDPDGGVDVVADAGPDAADVPGVAEALLQDGDVDGRLGDDDDLDAGGHAGVAAGLARVDPVRQAAGPAR